ncbi:RING/U-box superfamily protein [Forsythia ovata]|uniref:RING/U-box superfamily protein n=1 Tax=Forsythia ovata TaxID=205694 RepID=A0ABD1PXY4_9LAMI
MVGFNNNNVNKNSFAKTICSICYEDLKPIIEDLQSISVCGHVFHELCLQQWFEYCPNGKKRNCPVCKQTCSEAKVGRLYFQSISDPNDSSLSQKPHDYEENSEELQTEVKRLEGKVLGLSSALEKQQKEFKEVIDQEQLKVEVTLKNEALSQKSTAQQLLRKKSEELDRSTLECTTLQERNMALAKELAALKLASDLNLEEDEVLKFASLGHDAGSKETVQYKESTSSTGFRGSNTSTGDLIAVGADGRGGRIKVLRSLGQSSLDNKDASSWTKKFKHGANTNSVQSQGCLQIEHFFQRTGQ